MTTVEGKLAAMQVGSTSTAQQQTQRPRWDSTTKIVVAVLLIVLAGLAFYLFRVVFIPLVIGLIFAYILTPVVRFISRKLRIPHGLATGLVYLVGLAVVSPAIGSLVPWVIGRVQYLQGELGNFVIYLDEISSQTVQIMGFELVVGDITAEARDALRELVRSAAGTSIELVFRSAETLLMVIFTFLIAFYLTSDADRFTTALKGLIPPNYKEDVERLMAEIDAIWSAFLRGQVMLSVVVAVLLTGISGLIGLPQPILMGVLGGLLEFLPSVGHAIWLITASILALVEGSTTLPVSHFVFLLVVIGAHTLYTQIDLNFLIPRIIGRQVHLHPMVVILGIIIGAQVGGVLGIALAAPTIASLRVIGRYIYALLFDLEPFPMVGAPSAPVPVREQQAAEMAAARTSSSIPKAGEAIGKIRERTERVLVRRRRRRNQINTPQE